MAIANLLNLFDDVATIMDDVAVLTKKASAKTAALMGDDLAVNSEQMIGLTATQEFPVVSKIFLGALVNNYFNSDRFRLLNSFPIGLTIVLILGGLFLCFEGAEKVVEKLSSFFGKSKHSENKKKDISIDERIKGAVRTDFILSIEILAIAASTMTNSDTLTTLISLSVVGVLVTVIIYGVVLLIIKLDDMGLALVKTPVRNFK